MNGKQKITASTMAMATLAKTERKSECACVRARKPALEQASGTSKTA